MKELSIIEGKIKYTVLKPHSKKCMVEEFGSIPTETSVVWLDSEKSGRSSANKMLIKLSCNDPGCGAIVALDLNSVLKSINKQLASFRKTP